MLFGNKDGDPLTRALLFAYFIVILITFFFRLFTRSTEKALTSKCRCNLEEF
jgi:hypothetical protein